jgi:hypothetical protein
MGGTGIHKCDYSVMHYREVYFIFVDIDKGQRFRKEYPQMSGLHYLHK